MTPDDDTTKAAAAPAGFTGAQLAATIAAVGPALATLQAAMASPAFAGAIILAEDVEQALAFADIPGASIALAATETAVEIAPVAIADISAAWPWIAPFVSAWLSSSASSASDIGAGRGAGGRNYGR